MMELVHDKDGKLIAIRIEIPENVKMVTKADTGEIVYAKDSIIESATEEMIDLLHRATNA